MQHSYQTNGTCSREILFEIEDGKLKNVQYIGGCNGNLKGISALAEGMEAAFLAEKLSSIQSVVSGVGENQKLLLLLCMTILPCVLMLLSNFLYQKKYKLDEAEYARICKELQK